MFNLQGSEIIVILLLALVVLGPEKLPDAIRKFSQTYNELKKMGTGFQSEIKSALDEPMREMRETADLLKDSVDPDKLQSEAAAEAELQRQAEAEAVRMAAIDEAEEAAAAARDHADRADDELSGDDASDAEASHDQGPDDDEVPVDEGPDDDVVVAAADVPPRPINQIAQANARSRIEPVTASAVDVDVDAVPAFSNAPETPSSPTDAAVIGGAETADASGDDANEAAVS